MAFQEPALTADYGLAKRISPKKVGLGHLVQEKQNLLWAKSSASAADVMQLLQSNGLVALPIYDEKRKKFIGVAHIFDVTMALLDGSQGAVDEPKNIVSSEAVIKRATERASQSIGDLLFNDVTECMVCFHCADPIEKAIKPLNAVPHHVLVTMTNEQEENEEQLEAGGVVEGRYRLLSQTDVVRFLSRHQHELERELLDRVLLATIDELGLVADRPVVSCFPAEGKLALDAFNEMKENKVSAVGVCEKGTGRLLYNLAASDLRGMTVQKMHLLLRPVPEFLSQLGSRKLIFPITAQPETRVRDLLENLLAGRSHRAYVIDDQQRPIAVISYTDILSKIIP
ncbi:CBS domain containing protein [Acanthamoeba castellanii str. Neff]|uniref:CBS domain containing protein n=1 Tax=Acanthamoeba castellanii (strain ATCC 30010 / Neff) TaxID=1257118 RepID=L8GEW8_ACACF|nr:CBS domain containing protein [Acanthamoeba castellanii str. Neff]ELR11595.1 CBS domain containing protein [Acanthamoeba castellanii str. Neff]